MNHEDYKKYHEAKDRAVKILRVLDAFDPITGRGLNEDGSRDPKVLTADEQAVLPAYLNINKSTIEQTVDQHLIKGIDAFGAYLEYAGFSQEFLRDVPDKALSKIKDRKEREKIEEMRFGL